MLDLSTGKHLILDLYGCKSVLLSDRIALLRFLDELPGRISMSILSPAIVKEDKYPKCDIEDEGISGFVIIHESHISVHTFTRRGFVELDVCSCKDFDEDAVTEIIGQAFMPEQIDAQLVRRGRLHAQEKE